MILNALTAGAGAPVLLLHGLFGAAKNLGVIARGLAARHRVLSLDLRNHGDSLHHATMDYASMAADVAETMAAHGVGPAMVVGHSMGGKVAMVLALTRPGLVERLAVLDIAPVSYRHGYSAYVAAMRAIPLAAGLTRHEADAMLAAAVPEAALRQFLLNNLVLGGAPRWRLGLAEIGDAMPEILGWVDPPGVLPYPGPTLFLAGGNSDYIGQEADAAIARLFPNAARGTISGAGHWLHAERPAAVIEALEMFLAADRPLVGQS